MGKSTKRWVKSRKSKKSRSNVLITCMDHLIRKVIWSMKCELPQVHFVWSGKWVFKVGWYFFFFFSKYIICNLQASGEWDAVWKHKKFTFTEKRIRQINYLLLPPKELFREINSFVLTHITQKCCFHENFVRTFWETIFDHKCWYFRWLNSTLIVFLLCIILCMYHPNLIFYTSYLTSLILNQVPNILFSEPK